MNERIKELAEQATKQVTKPDGHYIVQEWQKVFAELIVRESMHVILLEGKTIADAMPDANRDNYTMVAEQTGMINASMRYANKIKQHFGVE